MDATDKRILKRWQENARVTVSVLSQEISLSMPAISERLKKLENTGVVQQYTAILNPALVDKHLMAFIYISFALIVGLPHKSLVSLPRITLFL